MRRLIRRFALGTLIVYSFSFTAIQAHPRLPKPSVTEAIVLAVDMDTQSLVVKTGKYEKPFVLDWERRQRFSGVTTRLALRA